MAVSIDSSAQLAEFRQNTTGLGEAGEIVLSPPLDEQVAVQSFGPALPQPGFPTGPYLVGGFARAPNSPKLLNANWGIQMRIIHLACAVILLSAALLGRPNGAVAEVSDAVRQACTPDAMRLCSDVIPDVAKITACMKAKSSQISEPCRLAMRAGMHGKTYHHGHYRHHYRHCHHCS